MGDGERTREIKKERDVGDRERIKKINKILYNLATMHTIATLQI